MQDGMEAMVDPDGNCTQQLFNLFIIGKATPYLHNGSLNIQKEGEDKMSVERYNNQIHPLTSYLDINGHFGGLSK